MSAWKIALSDLDYGREEEEAALAVLRSKWLTMGAVALAFEEEFAAEIGVRHAIAVSNGTDALLLSYLALGIGAGDEIVQPAVNFVAAANMAVRAGARPVFADICSLEEPTIDPAAAAACITPRTRAVVVMHYGGAPCRMNELSEICKDRGVALIEDACHGVGGSGHGRKMGAWGDAAAFSFFSNKNLAVGEGGMIATDRDDLAAALRSLRSHGMTTLTWDRHRGHASTYDVARHGLNCRIDEIRSALGREQLKKLGRNNARRRELARQYHRALNETALVARGWIFPRLGIDADEAAHHLMTAVAPDGQTRGEAMDRLKNAGIQTSIHYPFIPGFTAFETTPCDRAALANSNAFCDRVLTLPLHPLMSLEDVQTVVAELQK
ncbi:MAG: DegT/DnrJ/EryC1/StrS family aminotransferase [Candidatus Sumerlaeia bacterium]